MIFFAVPLVVFMIGLIFVLRSKMEPARHDAGISMMTTSGVVLFLIFVVFIAIRGEHQKTPELHARLTGYLQLVDVQKDKEASACARSMFCIDIERANDEIERARAWNHTIFDIFFDDETATLEPIK